MFHQNLEQGSKRYQEHHNVIALYASRPKDKAKGPDRQVFPAHVPKIRDFAYDQSDDQHHHDGDPALSAAAFLASFTDSGFRTRYRRVNTDDLLSQAGVPGFEKLPPALASQNAPVVNHHHDPLLVITKEPQRPNNNNDNNQHRHDAQEEEYTPPTSSSSSSWPEEEEEEENPSRADSASSSEDTTTAADGVDDALMPLIAKKGKEKDKKKRKKRKRKSNSDVKENQEYSRQNNWGFRDVKVITAVAACMMEYLH